MTYQKPTMEEIRRTYLCMFTDAAQGVRADAFDRWLAEHDRQVAERAWSGGWAAAGAWEIAAPGTPYPWNPYRKDQENTNA